MGTDIHPVVQVRREGAWVDVNGAGPLVDGRRAVLHERSYSLFAVLANVRNGFGFAGVYTHDPLTPISEPRGFPPDFEVHDGEYHGTLKDKWWADGDPLGVNMGDHGFSWVTLAELDAYPWEAPLRRGGVLTLANYKAWDGQSQPTQWSGRVMGRNIVTVSRYDADRGRYPAGMDVYVEVGWTTTVGAAVGAFYTEALPWLRTLGKPDDVRLVFGFDS